MAIWFLGSCFYGDDNRYGELHVAESEEKYEEFRDSLCEMVDLPPVWEKLKYEECQKIMRQIENIAEMGWGITVEENILLDNIYGLLSAIPEELGYLQSEVG